jgi:hypothetical protein
MRCRATARPESLQAITVAAGDLRRVDAGHVDNDLAHPHQSVQLDALGRADQRRAFGEQTLPLFDIGPHRLRRHGQQDRRHPAQRFFGVAGGTHTRRQLNARQVVGVVTAVVDFIGEVGSPRPQRDLAASVGEQFG